jgi:hypothetical protein
VYTGVPPDGRLTRGVLVDGSVLAARAAPAAEQAKVVAVTPAAAAASMIRSEEHTSELQSLRW